MGHQQAHTAFVNDFAIYQLTGILMLTKKSYYLPLRSHTCRIGCRSLIVFDTIAAKNKENMCSPYFQNITFMTRFYMREREFYLKVCVVNMFKNQSRCSRLGGKNRN